MRWIIPFKARKRLRRFGLVLGALAVVVFTLAGPTIFTHITGEQWPSSPAATVTAFSPSSPPYSSGRLSAVAQRGPGGYRVIDGDTIEAPYGVKYRLLGYDTPETYFSKCDAELELGRAATRRLELLASGEVRIVETGKTDKYRRALAHLYVNGRDVGAILIGEGLARPYEGGRREGWC